MDFTTSNAGNNNKQSVKYVLSCKPRGFKVILLSTLNDPYGVIITPFSLVLHKYYEKHFDTVL